MLPVWGIFLLSVCAIAKHPLLEDMETSSQRTYTLYIYIWHQKGLLSGNSILNRQQNGEIEEKANKGYNGDKGNKRDKGDKGHTEEKGYKGDKNTKKTQKTKETKATIQLRWHKY